MTLRLLRAVNMENSVLPLGRFGIFLCFDKVVKYTIRNIGIYPRLRLIMRNRLRIAFLVSGCVNSKHVARLDDFGFVAD